MAKITENLHLAKPEAGDPCDVTVLNANFDKLDEAIGTGRITLLAQDAGVGADGTIRLLESANSFRVLLAVVDTVSLFGLTQGSGCWLGGVRCGGTAIKLAGAQVNIASDGRSLTVKAINEMELRGTGITVVNQPKITAVYGLK